MRNADRHESRANVAPDTPTRAGDLAQRAIAVLALALVCAGTTAALVTSAEDPSSTNNAAMPRTTSALVAPPDTGTATSTTDTTASADATGTPSTQPSDPSQSSPAATLSPDEQRAMLDTLAQRNAPEGDGSRRMGGPYRGGGGGGKGLGRVGPANVGGGGGGGGAGRAPAPTTKESEDALDFVAEHAPNRYRFYDRMPADAPPKQRMTNMITNTYRRLQRVKEQDPEVYDLMVKRFELEDKIFDRDFRRSIMSGSADARSELRAKAAEIVQLSLRERAKRLERLERSLEAEKKALAADKANPEPLVDGHARRLQEQVRDMGQRFFEYRNRAGLSYGPGPGPGPGPRGRNAIAPTTGPASDQSEPRGAADDLVDADDTDLALLDAELINLFDSMVASPAATISR